MSGMRTVSIPCGSFKNGTVQVAETVLFSVENRSFLFCAENGVGIFLTTALAQTLIDGCPSDDLLFKLVGRGIAKTDAARRLRPFTEDSRPTFFLIDMTRRCNLRCDYCIRNTYRDPAATADISLEQLMEICQYIARHVQREKIGHFTIQPWGGEPTLELDKLIAIREFFDVHGLHPAIKFVCNGTLLTAEMVKRLKQYRLEYSISMDGDKPLHDTHRVTHDGTGSYDAVRAGIQQVQAHTAMPLSTITTLTAETLGEAPRILRHLAAECGIRFVKLNFVNIASDDDMAIATDRIKDGVQAVLQSLITLHGEGLAVTEANVRQRTRNLVCRNNENICLSAGCQGGRRMVSFDFEGNIYPCELIGDTQVMLGNIHDGKGLRELLEAAYAQNPYFKDRREEGCRSCYWRYFCRGGCTSAARVQENTHTEIDVTTCVLNKSMYPLLIEYLLTDPATEQLFTGQGDGV